MKRFAVLALVMSMELAAAAQSTKTPAADLARDARKAFDAGQFDVAAQLLEQAYALQPAPALLFNIGRAQLQAGHLEDAVAAYKRYLEAAPDATDANAVRTTIDELEARMAREAELRKQAEEAKERREAPPPAPIVVRSESHTPIPWIVAGAGALTLGASIPLWIVGSNAHADAIAAPDVRTSDAKQNTAQSFATATTVTLVVGGALLAIGLVWGIVDRARPRKIASNLRLEF
jgi:iron complex outermembrane receptor protein